MIATMGTTQQALMQFERQLLGNKEKATQIKNAITVSVKNIGRRIIKLIRMPWKLVWHKSTTTKVVSSKSLFNMHALPMQNSD